MQFLILGYDGDDEGALDRRLAVREDHLALGDQMVADGTFWYGAAMRDDDDKMIGSIMIMDFPDRAGLDTWLEKEPYVTGDVWRKIEISRCSTNKPWQFNRSQEFYETRQQ